ncbi:glycerol-3-phosphate 1-O-acyltransferase PlsY [Gemmatimonadota bacterium]
MLISYITASLAAFLAGAMPTSYFVGRILRGIDLRQHGSGNLGATNVFRVMGTVPALLVLTVDIFKGFFPVFWLAGLISVPSVIVPQCVLGICAVAGHIFSPFVGFRGGKGVATGAGVLLAISPAVVGICVLIWLVLFATLRIVSVASLAAALTLPLAIFLSMDHGAAGFGVFQAFGLLVATGVIFAHRANIGRLLRGEEKRLSRGGGNR